MSTDMNRVTVIGRLTRDPELRFTQSKTAVCSFSLANNRSYVTNNEKREMVSFFNCVLWGKAGEALAKWSKKGNRLGIDGYLQQRSWEDKDGNKKYTVEIVAESFQFLESKKEDGSNNEHPEYETSMSAKEAGYSDEEGF